MESYAPAAPRAVATSENVIVPNSAAAKHTLFTLHSELRDNIWGFCTALRPNQEPVVVGHRLLLYTTNEQGEWDYPPERFDQLIPIANKQMYGEAYNLFCKTYRFNLVLNEGSCMGRVISWPKSGLKNAPSIAAMPSLWSSSLRHSIRQVQRFRIFVAVISEHEDGQQLSTVGTWMRKNQCCLIVRDAAESICEILTFSERLTSVDIVNTDLERPGLTTGHMSAILTPFLHLKRIRHVEIDGVSKLWTQDLKTTIELDK